jgi:hypothetical protein
MQLVEGFGGDFRFRFWADFREYAGVFHTFVLPKRKSVGWLLHVSPEKFWVSFWVFGLPSDAFFVHVTQSQHSNGRGQKTQARPTQASNNIRNAQGSEAPEPRRWHQPVASLVHAKVPYSAAYHELDSGALTLAGSVRN